MKKKTLGYGFKLKNETMENALSIYGDGGYLKSPKEVKEEISKAKEEGAIGKNCRPKIFKVEVTVYG